MSRNIKLIEKDSKDILGNLNNDITTFALDVSRSEVIDSGILLNDLNMTGSYDSYYADEKEIRPSVPVILERSSRIRNIDFSDTFIKPMIELNESELSENLNEKFYFVQTKLSDAYNEKLNDAFNNDLLTKFKTIALYHDNTKYFLAYYRYKNFIVASVPNSIIKEKNITGYTWYLVSPIKGKVYYENEIPYFIPDKIIYSGVSYRNVRALINISLKNAIEEKSRIRK